MSVKSLVYVTNALWKPGEECVSLDLPNGSAPLHPDEVSERSKYLFFILLGGALIILAFFFNSPQEIWAGSITILTSPANLITDYFELANIGATLLNAGIMTLTSLALIRTNHAKLTGSLAAAIFTVAGFSFFGKNLYNSMPIILGVILYSKIVSMPFNRFLLQALFGTSLGPLVSEITFHLNLPTAAGFVMGISAGMLAGLILPPLSGHFLKFHQGFNLYNIGFTAGIVGMFFLAIFRGFGIEIEMVSILSSGNNGSFSIMLYVLFACMLIWGLYLNHWSLKGYGRLLSLSGKLATDFVTIAGLGLTLINMAFLGMLSTSYVLAVGGEINGPIIGGIFTVVGFGAFGKHIKNVAPIFAGVYLANLFIVHDASSTISLLGALFGTTLAPLAGYYGIGAGVIAGALHMVMVTNISYLHAGMNLYNNGFSGGFIAAALVPLFDTAAQIREARKGTNLIDP